MSYLYFEVTESTERKQEYNDLLAQFAKAVEQGAKFLLRSIQLLQANEKHADHYAPSVIFSLGRHVAEEIDAVSVLLRQGCIAVAHEKRTGVGDTFLPPSGKV